MSSTDPRETKLPVWAQDMITGLRRRVERETTHRRALVAEAKDGDVYTYRFRSKTYALPDDIRLRVQVPGTHFWVDTHAHEGGVRVMCSDSVIIEPEGSKIVTNVNYDNCDDILQRLVGRLKGDRT